MALAQTAPEGALEALEDGLTDARGVADPSEISAVARHAAAICDHLGHLSRALGYYEEAIVGEPDNGYLHFATGDVLRRLHAPGARGRFTRSLELALEQGDRELADLASAAIAAGEHQDS